MKQESKHERGNVLTKLFSSTIHQNPKRNCPRFGTKKKPHSKTLQKNQLRHRPQRLSTARGAFTKHHYTSLNLVIIVKTNVTGLASNASAFIPLAARVCLCSSGKPNYLRGPSPSGAPPPPIAKVDPTPAPPRHLTEVILSVNFINPASPEFESFLRQMIPARGTCMSCRGSSSRPQPLSNPLRARVNLNRLAPLLRKRRRGNSRFFFFKNKFYSFKDLIILVNLQQRNQRDTYGCRVVFTP